MARKILALCLLAGIAPLNFFACIALGIKTFDVGFVLFFVWCVLSGGVAGRVGAKILCRS